MKFAPYRPEKLSVTHAFRIFTHGNKGSDVPNLKLLGALDNPINIAIHAQPAAFDPTLNMHVAGLGFCSEVSGGKHRKIASEKIISGLAASAIALKNVLEVTDRSRPLVIETTSKALVKLATEKLAAREDSGYIDIPEKYFVRSAIASLRRFPHQIAFKLVDRGARSENVQNDNKIGESGTSTRGDVASHHGSAGEPGARSRGCKAQHNYSRPRLQGNQIF